MGVKRRNSFRNGSTPKFVSADPKNGGQLAVLHGGEVKFLGSAVQQFNVLGQLLVVGSADQLV